MDQMNIYKAITTIMDEVDAIGKNKRNQQQGFAYRGIDDMYNELQPKFAKHKVFITSEVLECTREERTSKNGGLLLWTVLKVRFTFFSEDGSSVSSVMVGEAMDSGDKGANKAVSIALKYCLMQLLLIPTEDLKKDDNDGHISQPEPKKLIEKKIEKKESTPFEAWEIRVMNCQNMKDLTDLYSKHKAEVDGNQLVKDLIANRRNQINGKTLSNA